MYTLREMGGLIHTHLLTIVLATCTVWLLAGCASPDAIKAPNSGETAIAEEEPATPAVEEKTAAPLREETEADRPEATTEVKEASQKTPVQNVYAGAMSTEVREDLRGIPERVYVPNIIDGTVSVIDPNTFEIVDEYAVGELP